MRPARGKRFDVPRMFGRRKRVDDRLILARHRRQNIVLAGDQLGPILRFECRVRIMRLRARCRPVLGSPFLPAAIEHCRIVEAESAQCPPCARRPGVIAAIIKNSFRAGANAKSRHHFADMRRATASFADADRPYLSVRPSRRKTPRRECGSCHTRRGRSQRHNRRRVLRASRPCNPECAGPRLSDALQANRSRRAALGSFDAAFMFVSSMFEASEAMSRRATRRAPQLRANTALLPSSRTAPSHKSRSNVDKACALP